ncbi:hypothetical protein LLE49_03360 [Alicyclobacillus tolerans]|uniref:YkvI family membrane protein n=1 Tax=Alicyclobacillus tolerans TaxID=90970 RepID=UPI001F24231C|nr:hypothetical protein [Alicyclobacillus tolerans]MCF8563776.1 hypothetical protein [Alicyclobacillus tolerans]
MDRSKLWQAFQVGCAYIGTVVGAGFASGQEIYQFFGRFGNIGYIGIGLSILLFTWLGYRLMILGHRLNAKSYREVNAYLFGRWIGTAVDAALLVMLFGVTVAMLAGAGELFRERMHMSFQIGVLITIAITFFTVLRGIEGILRANTIIVPVMVSFVLFAAVHAWHNHGFVRTWQWGQGFTGSSPWLGLTSAVVYVSLNIGLASGVLIPLGSNTKDPGALKAGALMGALGLGMMLLAVTFTLFAHSPTALHYAVPMGYIATQLGRVVQWVFVFVLWGEIYSTLVGNVYAIGTQISSRSTRLSALYIALILGAAFLVSQVGFVNIVRYAYSLFGWICILLLMALLWPRRELRP